MAKQPHTLEVVVRPMITEKATRLGGENKYMFQVRRGVNKVQIKEAVQKGFDVKVVDVNVMNVRGKPRRVRGNRMLHKPDWKKAIVTLAPGEKIELFEGV